MGFQAKRKLYKLIFEDEDMEGLKVVMRSLSVGKLLELEELTSKVGPTPKAQTLSEKGNFYALMEVFSAAINEWNLEDENGEPIPTTIAGVLEQDADFLMTIIAAWTNAMSGVSGPLDSGSTSSENSLAESIPVEILSPSLVN